MSDWSDVCSRLGVSATRSAHMVRCPAHDDKKGSLSIKAKGDGGLVLNCFAGCDWKTVRASLNLAAAPTRTLQSEPVTARSIVAEYEYRDATGKTIATKRRWGPVKSFDWISRDEHGVRRAGLPEGGQSRLPLYRLPDVLAAVARCDTVWIVEGEKDADALTTLGYCATCNPEGASGAKTAYESARWLPLKGAAVGIIPDNDEPGRRHAEKIADVLLSLGAVPRIVALGGAPKNDVSDYLATGNTTESLLALYNDSPEWGHDGSRKPSRPRPRTLRDWLSDPDLLTPPATVIPYLAWQGRVSLFSAREKIGKSTITGQAVAAATRGGEFLGERVAPCDVLWYGIDEPIGDAARRLQENGADIDRVLLSDTRPESADQLRADLANFPNVRLVVIDTLTELASGQLESDRDAQQIAVFIRPYVEIARSVGVALLLIHHTTKAGREYRGSVQLGASVDVKVQLRQPEQRDTDDVDDEPMSDDGLRFLDASGRGVKYGIRLQFDAGRYRLADAPPSLRDRVFDGVVTFGPISGSKLAEALGVRKQRVLETLNALRTEGVCFAPEGKWQLTPVGRKAAATGSGDSGLGTGQGNREVAPVPAPSSHDEYTGTGGDAPEAPSEPQLDVALTDEGYPADWDTAREEAA